MLKPFILYRIQQYFLRRPFDAGEWVFIPKSIYIDGEFLVMEVDASTQGDKTNSKLLARSLQVMALKVKYFDEKIDTKILII
jgi:hypothetical protein